jgi:hypothetical protein
MNPSFDHLKNLLANPQNGDALQRTYNAKRMANAEFALLSRPHFLPVIHTLPAAPETMPVAETTEQLNHPVIVFGAITDGEDRKARFARDREARAIVRYGSQSVKLSLDALAGHSVASAGLPGVYRFPEPFLLDTNDVLTLEIYQETTPGVEEQVATVFCGERVYRANSAEATMEPRVRASVLDAISRRPAPEPRELVCPVAFDADGFATAETPRADEPLMILGFRSTFTDALINFGFDGDTSFARSRFPIWALCSEPNNGRQLYQMLKSPLFLPANQQLQFSLKNTIDGNLIATDGNIEVLARTV